MLTFEDFFAKKKIDLKALESDNKELYQEFYQHYHAMGEKSFDHTKKFWFNRLRKSYRLDEPELSVPKERLKGKETAAVTSASSALGFRPKFSVKPKEQEENTNSEKESALVQTPETANKPAGFKPRFKTGVTKPAVSAPAENTSEQPSEEVAEPSNKPVGFKPRFKAGVTKPAVSAPAENTSEQPSEEVAEPSNKPVGFKPRFKAGVTKMKEGDESDKKGS